jgi:hypothetical protein
VESYREVRRMFERRSEFDKAFVIAEIMVFLRSKNQEEELLFDEFKLKVAPHAGADLTPEDHERLITHPDERGPARAILEILANELSKVYPADLSPYDVNPRTDKHGTKSDLPVRKQADELAKVLGAPMFDLWITKKHDLGMFLENEDPPALILGAGVLRRIQERELRFMLARQLERLKGGHHLLYRLPPREVEMMVWAAAKLGRPDLRVDQDPIELDSMMKKLARVLSRRARKMLEDLSPKFQGMRFDLDRHKAAAIHTANRAGLVMTNDIEVVARSIAREANIKAMFRDAEGARETIGQSHEIREMLSFAVSEEYFAARAKLGFSIQS